MTKKEFKEQCIFQEYGNGRTKRNAIYYGYAEDLDKGFRGYKFMVKARVEDATKADLFRVFYEWVNEKIQQPPYYVDYNYALTDHDRFRISLMG